MEYGGTWFGVVALLIVALVVHLVAKLVRRRGPTPIGRWAKAHERAAVILVTFGVFALFYCADVLAIDEGSGEAFERALIAAVACFVVESIALARREDETRAERPPVD